MKAAVIGSGIGGLAIAIRLALKGYEVTVYEQNDRAGGKISEIRSGGYRFDTGPSLFTLPELANELFELSGKAMKDYFEYSKLDVICSYFYQDGTRLQAYSDPVLFAREVERQTGEPASRIMHHLKKCREQYDLTAEIFLFNSLHKLKNYFHWRILKGLMQFHKVDAFTTMHKRNRSRFTDNRVIRLFDRYATYNGSNPYVAPATLNVISHLEHNLGAYFPTRGMRSLAGALESLARDNGVRFLFSHKVDRIVSSGNRTTGLVSRGTFQPFDLVVSDVDINYFYKDLLPGETSTRDRTGNLSSSALIFYWGVRRQTEKLGLHNILFSDRYEDEFRHIFDGRSVFDDPTVYIFISSRAVPSDAPEHCENWFVMINVPPDTGQNWKEITAQARRNIIRKINRMLNIDIEDGIEFEETGTPLTIESSTMSWKGALYGDHSNSRYSAFLRHPFRHKSIKNLYFVGGSVHPGGGIPLCLASAKIADREIQAVKET